MKLRRYKYKRGPVADGCCRDTLVTQQSTDYWATPLLSGHPSSVSPGRPRPLSQDSRLHGVSASPQENTHRAYSHNPAAALDSHALPLGCYSSSFTLCLTALTGSHHMPRTRMNLYAYNVHHLKPLYYQSRPSRL